MVCIRLNDQFEERAEDFERKGKGRRKTVIDIYSLYQKKQDGMSLLTRFAVL
jgi:hypothetical protein